MPDQTNEVLFRESSKYLPGGVTAATRLNKALHGVFFISRGDGAKVYDVEGREYVDLCTSHGASFLGHNNAKIKAAIGQALEMGIVCSAETEFQTRLAKKIVEMIPSAEQVRFATSGTEATMYAIRAARAYTGKEKIVKFEGHFHGIHDYAEWSFAPPLDQAGPEDSPTPYAQTSGIPAAIRDLVIPLPFNNLPVLEKTLKARKDEIAAVILEPVCYNCGCLKPRPGYLEALRELTRNLNIVLIFDEVLSGFRMAPGGVQQYLGVTPDLTTLAKALAGGVPLSAFCGKREIMEQFSPVGRAEHSGTYNAHLIPIMASLASLEQISAPGFYDHIDELGDRLYSGLEEIIGRLGLKIRLQYLGARFALHFGVDPDVEIVDYRQSLGHDVNMHLKFLAAAVRNGVYFHDYGGRPAHHGFSAAHTPADIDRALEGIDAALRTLV
jgi:glutamate-1-semialdehyde 2,1-aminomutase